MTLDDCYEAKNQILNTKLEKNIYVPTYLFESDRKSHSEKNHTTLWTSSMVGQKFTFFVVATPSGYYIQESIGISNIGLSC